jgi:UDPglucose 6-dehydrogenase
MLGVGRLSFTLDLASAMKGADAVFIAVGTPTRRGDGHADLTYVYAAAEEVAHLIDDYTVVVTKLTVPVGTNRQVKQIIRKANKGALFDVVSNPEFLREGAAIDDFMRPD